MATAGTISTLLNSISNSSDQMTVLESLNTLLSMTSPHELRQITPNVSFDVVFDCLSSENKDQVELACNVLYKFLSACDSTLILQSFQAELIKWLRDYTTPVKRLGLAQLTNVVKENEETLADYPDVVFRLVLCLRDDNLEVAEKSGVILSSLGQSVHGLSVLFGDPVKKCLRDIMAQSDIVRFRVYKMIVDLTRISKLAMDKCAEAGILHQLISEMNQDDILVQLNSLEMLSDLAQEEHGLRYLDGQGIVRKLEDMMSDLQNNPMANFLLPGLMKFFGGLARIHPKEVCGKFNKFTHTVFENVDGPDHSLQGVAIDTIGFIGSTVEGKLALEKLGSSMDSCLQKFGNIIKNSMSDLRTRTLQAVTSLLKLAVEDQTMDLLTLTESWFLKLCPKSFDVIWSITQQPFTDIRHDCYGLLQALALQPWGQRLMNEKPGFNEFLLDRSTESSREGKEAKYELVKTLSNSPTIIEVFGNFYSMRVVEYCRQGAFYVRAQADVAYEEG